MKKLGCTNRSRHIHFVQKRFDSHGRVILRQLNEKNAHKGFQMLSAADGAKTMVSALCNLLEIVLTNDKIISQSVIFAIITITINILL